MKLEFISDLKKLKDFIPFEEPVSFDGFEAIGYFPYEKAAIIDCVSAPRNVFKEVENKLSRTRYMDNKVVVVFRDLVNFGTKDFAIQFKDAYCKMGKISQIVGYGGRDLKVNKPKNTHTTTIPLYIRAHKTSLEKGFNIVEIPIGTELEFVKYGDEDSTYSSDPVHANCYSGATKEFTFDCKFLFTDSNNIWSFYKVK